MQRWIALLGLLCGLWLPCSLSAKLGLILEINGAIGPATQDYVQRGVEQAIRDKADIIVLEINTPGGLETAMRGINEVLIASPIPIVSYVAPSGARAASAGTYLVYASHIAYMAPGSNMGSASPIDMLSSSKKEGQVSTEEKKAINDAAAYLRGLAQLRGRNAEWAEKAVREAANLSAQEAKKSGIIDEVIENYDQLLKDLDGRTVKLEKGHVTLATKDLVLKRIQRDWRYQFLSFLTNPNIAYLLMLAAAYGLFFELSNPGLILPGVVGVISLVLVLYAFQLMQINYVGLTLLLIGLSFLILELFVPSFGILAIGGLIAFVIGSVMLFDVPGLNNPLSLSFIITFTLLTAIFFFVVLKLAIKSFKRPVISGKEGLIGQQGEVIGIKNDKATVKIMGEIWQAQSSSSLSLHQKIVVKKVKGLLLEVEPIIENKE